MPIFGQVWLWSSLAFLLGAVLCWLLVARPARNRVSELEAQLTPRGRRAGQERQEPSRERDDEAEFNRSVVPGVGSRDDDSEYLTRAYGLRATPPPLPPERERVSDFPSPEPAHEPFSFDGEPSGPSEHDTELADQPRAVATQYLDVSAGSLTAPPEVPTMSPPPSDRGWFDDELEGEAAGKAPEEQPAVPRNRHQLVEPAETGSADDELTTERPAIEDDSGGTVFTQRTRPIPGELIRQIDEAGKAERSHAVQPASVSDDLRDDLADDEHTVHEGRSTGLTTNTEDDLLVADAPAEPVVERRESTVEPESVPTPAPVFTEPEPSAALPPPELPAERTEIVSSAPPEPELPRPANDLPRRVPQQNRITQGVSVRVEPTPNVLPKRVPAKPRHQVPFGVQPSETPDSSSVATEDEVEPQRSLFEPIIPAADEGMSTPPPPHRLRQGGGGGRGPFGPGSAMPLPGGASPSPEFTIKASVAALRYCTPESPQFGRTVAEVWFRTAADAERVGFRPVG